MFLSTAGDYCLPTGPTVELGQHILKRESVSPVCVYEKHDSNKFFSKSLRPLLAFVPKISGNLEPGSSWAEYLETDYKSMLVTVECKAGNTILCQNHSCWTKIVGIIWGYIFQSNCQEQKCDSSSIVYMKDSTPQYSYNHLLNTRKTFIGFQNFWCVVCLSVCMCLTC